MSCMVYLVDLGCFGGICKADVYDVLCDVFLG